MWANSSIEAESSTFWISKLQWRCCRPLSYLSMEIPVCEDRVNALPRILGGDNQKNLVYSQGGIA